MNTVAIILTAYDLLLVAFLFGWRKVMRKPQTSRVRSPVKMSVVVPVRNEEHHISALLDDLQRQSFGNFEVIVVDDHSTDNTSVMLKQSKIKHIFVANDGHGKKSALTKGIHIATGEIIVTTDADCRVTPRWLESIAQGFQDHETQMLFGAVGMSGESFFDKLQSLEFASVVGASAATAALGVPTMCNGANLAFRKAVFSRVGGYAGNEHIASGDDEFLMRKILAVFPQGLRFNANPSSIVTTKPQPSLADFFYQRIRWAGKWQSNSSLIAIALALFILTTQVAAIMSWLYALDGALAVVVPLITKVVFEAVLIFSITRFLKTEFNVLAFSALQLIYPVYVIAIGILSNFVNYYWKGRSINRSKQNLYNIDANLNA